MFTVKTHDATLPDVSRAVAVTDDSAPTANVYSDRPFVPGGMDTGLALLTEYEIVTGSVRPTGVGVAKETVDIGLDKDAGQLRLAKAQKHST